MWIYTALLDNHIITAKWRNEINFPLIAPQYPKQHYCFKLRLFFLKIGVACSIELLWGISGMILTGENGITWRINVIVPLCKTQIPHVSEWTQVFAVRVRLLTPKTTSYLQRCQNFKFHYKVAILSHRGHTYFPVQRKTLYRPLMT